MAKGQFQKGNKMSKGRPEGTPNKLTATVKETVLNVFNELQGDKKNNLKAFAEKYPRDFYQIAAKLIPTDIKAQVRSTIKLQIVRDGTTSLEQPSQEPR